MEKERKDKENRVGRERKKKGEKRHRKRQIKDKNILEAKKEK